MTNSGVWTGPGPVAEEAAFGRLRRLDEYAPIWGEELNR